MGHLFYLYGIIYTPTNPTNLFSSLKGIDNQHEVIVKVHDELSAVVCHLDEEEYGEDVLQEKTNQVDWVQEKAFHHHEMLMKMREQVTIIPMKFCTIYKSEQSLQAMVESYYDQMLELVTQMEDKEEWNLKIYCDRNQLTESVADHNLNIKQKKAEIEQMSKGRQYLESRKLDQFIQQEVEKEQEAFGQKIHEHLADYCTDETVKKNWNHDVTGKEQEMCWNSAYLVPIEKVEIFLQKVTETNESYQNSGWIIEATGPWPAYHFVNLSYSEV